jgi:obg-like ATPase 1
MSPKKKVVEDVKGPWMLGKFSRSLKVGLVGMPNVGKSTLYNAMSKSHHAEAANYPFCTIDPNETRCFLEDERFNWLVEQHKPKSEVKPYLTVVDIAGLIRGASKGEGLGNAFLSHIRAVDGIIHVMRAFEDDDVIHSEDKVDPVRDIETITNELRIKDIEFLTSAMTEHKKKKQGEANKTPAHKKKWEDDQASFEKFLAWLEAGKDLRNGMDVWTIHDIDVLNDQQFLTSKPVMFAINMNQKDYIRKKNKFLKPIHEWVTTNAPGSAMVPYCGAWEMELAEFGEDKAVFAAAEAEAGTTTALNKMAKLAFNMVNLAYFYTAGPDEVRAWIIRRGFKAPQAAGVIHTDFEKGFICAEVMAFDELKEKGSEGAMKAAGRYRQEGKTYEVQDGDVIFFKFNVSGGKK